MSLLSSSFSNLYFLYSSCSTRSTSSLWFSRYSLKPASSRESGVISADRLSPVKFFFSIEELPVISEVIIFSLSSFIQVHISSLVSSRDDCSPFLGSTAVFENLAPQLIFFISPVRMPAGPASIKVEAPLLHAYPADSINSTGETTCFTRSSFTFSSS